jgi:hypothetical protein
MTSGVIVGGILLPGHQLLRVEQLPVGPSSNLVHHSRLQVNEDCPEKKSMFLNCPAYQIAAEQNNRIIPIYSSQQSKTGKMSTKNVR